MAIDSRGFDTIIVKTNEMIDYVPLTLEFNAFRPTPTGSEIKVNFQGNYYNGGFGSTNNNLEISWAYRAKDSGIWLNGGTFAQDSDYAISGNKFWSNGDVTLSDSLFLYQNNYEISIYYTDKLVNLSTSKIVPKGKPALYWQEHLVGIDGDFDARDGKGTFADLKCKNLLYTPYTENNKLTHTSQYYDEYWHTGYKCYLEAGKTYTFSCETDSDWSHVEMFLLKDDGYQLFYGMDNNPHTFTITETGYYYLRVDFNNQGETYSYWNFQVEEGSAKTEFAEAKEFNNQQNYSTSEQKIGTWIDGKPLYRKVIVTTNTRYNYAELGLYAIIDVKVMTTINNLYLFNTARYNSPQDAFTWYVDTQNQTINIDVGTTWTFNEAIITLVYTKTTD
jgi:hypothetical protein